MPPPPCPAFACPITIGASSKLPARTAVLTILGNMMYLLGCIVAPSRPPSSHQINPKWPLRVSSLRKTKWAWPIELCDRNTHSYSGIESDVGSQGWGPRRVTSVAAAISPQAERSPTLAYGLTVGLLVARTKSHTRGTSGPLLKLVYRQALGVPRARWCPPYTALAQERKAKARASVLPGAEAFAKLWLTSRLVLIWRQWQRDSQEETALAEVGSPFENWESWVGLRCKWVPIRLRNFKPPPGV